MVLEIHFTSGAVMLSGAKHLSQLLSCAVQAIRDSSRRSE